MISRTTVDLPAPMPPPIKRSTGWRFSCSTGMRRLLLEGTERREGEGEDATDEAEAGDRNPLVLLPWRLPLELPLPFPRTLSSSRSMEMRCCARSCVIARCIRCSLRAHQHRARASPQREKGRAGADATSQRLGGVGESREGETKLWKEVQGRQGV